MTEVEMPSAAGRQRRGCPGNRGLEAQPVNRLFANRLAGLLVDVEINDVEVRGAARGQSDHGVWPILPPLADRAFIRGRVVRRDLFCAI